jgi:hypothetical protein
VGAHGYSWEIPPSIEAVKKKSKVNSGFQSQAVVFTSSRSRNFWNEPATMKLYGHYGKSNLKAHALSPDAPHAPITAKSVG